MKIAICGGTLSGASLARVLSSSCAGKKIRIDLHKSLHDPARSKPHPLCEYEPLESGTAKSFSLLHNVSKKEQRQ